MFKGKLIGYVIFRANKMVYWVRILSLIFVIGIDRYGYNFRPKIIGIHRPHPLYF